MPIRLTKSELLEITDGQSTGTPKLIMHGLEYDSREIRGGELFVALKGEKQHGHEFLKTAYDRGAALFLVEDLNLLTSFPEPERLVVVSDTLVAFQKVAQAWRRRLGLPVIAVTGSVGKTTVKEMLAAILLKNSRGGFSLKSHNNHVGVPYTLCRLDPEHCWAVIEIGMNHAGEIATLVKIAEPDIALITKIAPAHMGAFLSIDEICAAKFEIVEGLKPTGKLLLNGEDPTILRYLSNNKLNYIPLFFGDSENSAVKVKNVASLGLNGISFDLVIENDSYPVTMSSLGAHNALNAAAATLAAHSLSANPSNETIVSALNSFKLPLRRLQTEPLTKGRTLIDDSYNANPESMAASLDFAGELAASGVKVGLILGDMLELGQNSPKFHQEIANKAAMSKPVFVIGVGQYAQVYRQAAAEQGITAFAAESAQAAGHLATKLNFDVILVKGSRDVGLLAVVEFLIEREGAAPAPPKNS